MQLERGCMKVMIGLVQVNLRDHYMAVWMLEPNIDNAMDESPHSETIVAIK